MSSITDALGLRFKQWFSLGPLGVPIFVLPIDKFHETMGLLKNDYSFIMLIDIAGVDNLKRPKNEWPHGKRFEAVYHLLNMEIHQRIMVKVPVSENDSIPTLTNIWKGADWYEREVWDLMGIQFIGNSSIPGRLFNHHQFIGHSLRKDYSLDKSYPLSFTEDISLQVSGTDRSTHRYWTDLGPVHPVFHGVRLVLELEGEIIRQSRLEVGYQHRAMEKIFESRYYSQISSLVSHLNFYTAPVDEMAFCQTLEMIMKIEIPDRAKALRMLLAELVRISSHLLCIGQTAYALGDMANFLFCLQERELISNLLERVGGARDGSNLMRIGGMVCDLPRGWVSYCLETIKKLSKDIEELDKTLTRSQIWVDRNQNCPISAADAIEWGLTGPTLRACGVNYDLRKVSSYYFYADVDFEIPLGIDGDGYDRYLVRLEEIRQSSKIINQILDYLPTGPVIIPGSQTTLPAKAEVYTQKEAKEKHFNFFQEGIVCPVGEAYSVFESPNGELGFYLISSGDAQPYRLKIRSPSFPIFQAYPSVIKDSGLTDALAAFSSLSALSGEVDR